MQNEADNQANRPFDKLDLSVIAALTGNIRRSAQDIARELQLSSATVKRRIERLRQDRLISLSPVVDLHAAGYEYLMIIGVKIGNQSPFSVATAIAELPQALTVNIVLGHFDIEVVAAVKSREEVAGLLTNTLALIPGVASLAPALALDIWKFQSSCSPEMVGLARATKKILDTLDLQIISCLNNNPRVSNRAIATQLAVSESAVRVRIKRMQEQKQISLNTVHNLHNGSDEAAFVGISAQGDKITAVCRALAKVPEVSFTCTTLGRHDIICCVEMNNLDSLTEVLHCTIASIDGVKSIETSHCMKQIKHQTLLGLIL
jgi:Lrp/AsnC family transcriptional regulator for asnA, asnC and gidA